jgi:hypothetical protein
MDNKKFDPEDTSTFLFLIPHFLFLIPFVLSI